MTPPMAMATGGGFDLLTDLAIILCVAAAATALFQKLRQPVILGYLLAGMIVGPHLPIPLFADETVAHTLSEIGVVLLMFALGLEFSLRKLIRVAPSAGIAAVIQCSLMLLLGYGAGVLFGWTTKESWFAGAIITVSSTTIIIKAFAEQGIGGKVAELVFGILVFEDIIGILLIAILTAVGSGAAPTAGSILATTGKLAAFLAGFMAVGMLIVPRLVRAILRLGRKETTLVGSVGLCFAFALLARAFGYSVALGAFLGGALVAESGQGKVVEHAIEPVRDVFGAVFFVSVGMLIDPAMVARHYQAVLVLTLLVVAGKLVGVGLGAFIAGHGIRLSVQAGLSLAQIGEFSFIIAALGVSLGATGHFLYPVAVAVSAITTLTTPWLIRGSGRMAAAFDKRLPHAVQTYAALYGSWVERLRGTETKTADKQRLRPLIGRLALDLASIVAILLGAAFARPYTDSLVHTHFGWGPAMAHALLAAVVTLVLSPFLWGAMRLSRALGLCLAAMALAPQTAALDLAAAPRRALVATVQLAILLVAGGILVVVLQPFYPSVPGILVLLGVALLLLYPLWRSAANLQGHTRASAQVILEALAAQGWDEHASPLPDSAHDLVPGLGETSLLPINAGSPVEGKSLGEIGLRGKTGATVIAIRRGAEGIVAPGAGERLQAGDVLVLMGTSESLLAAQVLLARPTLDSSSR